MSLLLRLVFIFYLIVIFLFKTLLFRFSTMALCHHQLRLVSHIYFLSASSCSLDRLILWAPLSMRWTNTHTKTPSIMEQLKLLSLEFYAAWNLFFFLLLELHFLSYLGYGLMVEYRTLRNQNSSICRNNNRDSNNILQHQ